MDTTQPNGSLPNNGTYITFSNGNRSIPLIIIGSIAIGSMLIHLLITFILKQIAKKTGWTFDIEVVKYCALPSFFTFPLISIISTLSLIPNVDMAIIEPIRHALEILLIIFTTWTALGFVKASTKTLSKDKEFIKSSNNSSRKLQTQLIVVTRIIYGLIICIGVSAIILTFPKAREIGVSVLASASVAALLIGLAAKPSMENLIASLQIALTQPLLLGDYIIIDGQQGVVEEIEAQFVTIRTHDERRIIIPLSRVVNGIFENWTRTEENIGINFTFFVDYGIPLKDLRKYYINFILNNSKYWDQRDGSIDIDECKESCLKLKAYMTASNAKNAQKLKIEVCEELMEYIITTYPEYLPRSRGQSVERRNMNRMVTKMEEAKLEDHVYQEK